MRYRSYKKPATEDYIPTIFTSSKLIFEIPTPKMINSFLNYVIAAFFCIIIPAIAHPQIKKIYLSPKANTSAKQSLFVDSIQFVPLEKPPGDAEPDAFTNIQVTEKYYFLNNFNNKYIQLFSKDGRFIKKINYKKLGEGFSPSYSEGSNQIIFFGNNRSYTLTPKDRVKIRLDATNPKNTKYYKKYRVDLNDTTFAIEKVVPDENDIIQAYPFYDGFYWRGGVNTSPLYKDSLDYELKIFKNGKPVRTYFPYNRINEPRFLYTEENLGLNFTPTPGVQIITRPYSDTIYRMTKDSLVPVYKLVLPMENALPPTFYTKPFKSKTDRENFQRNSGWTMRQINNFYETDQFIFFSIRYFQNYESYIYQKLNNTTYKTRSVRADTSQFNLQLLTDNSLQRRGSWFYKALKAGDLLRFFDEHTTAMVPRELEEFLKSKPNPSLPVIVQFKLKNTL